MISKRAEVVDGQRPDLISLTFPRRSVKRLLAVVALWAALWFGKAWLAGRDRDVAAEAWNRGYALGWDAAARALDPNGTRALPPSVPPGR